MIDYFKIALGVAIGFCLGTAFIDGKTTFEADGLRKKVETTSQKLEQCQGTLKRHNDKVESFYTDWRK